MNTAKRIRDARINRLMTQKQVALELGVDAITVSRWERGATEPSELQRVKLSRLFGGHPDDYRTEVAA